MPDNLEQASYVPYLVLMDEGSLTGSVEDPVGLVLREQAVPASSVSGVTAEEVVEAYRQHYVPLCRLARFLVDSGDRAEEVVQEVFTKTYSRRFAISDPEALQPYLRTAVLRTCHSELRRRRLERRLGLGWTARSLDEPDVTGTASLLTESDPSLSLVIRKALGALTPRQREAVVLHYLCDLDQGTVGAMLGCSVGTVKSQLAKARARLGPLLAEPVEHAEDACGRRQP